MTMKKTNKFGKYVVSALCFLLAACIGLVSSVQLISHAVEETVYVENIRLVTVDSGSNARSKAQALVGSDYIVADKVELNPGTDTGKDVYLAYRTTTNPDMAIRDIKLMSMDSGYTVYDYKELNEYIAAQNADKTQSLEKAAKAFAENLKAGSPRAIDSYKVLNLFRVEKDGKELLGDFIAEGKADSKFFAKMLMNSNTQALNAVIGFINVGLTPYLNEYDEESGQQVTSDWASLVPVSALWQQYADGLTKDQEIALDKKYNDTARELFHQIQDFTTYYENARANAGDNYENLNLNTNGDINDAPEAMENVDENDMDVSYIVCYEKLNEYQFDETTALGDWFLSLGRQTSDEVDIRQLYPVIDAMGENQANIVNTGGFISAVFNLAENEHKDDLDKMVQEVKDTLKSVDGTQTIYLFDNRDDIFYTNSKFAVTSDTMRQSAASNPIDRTSCWWDDLYDQYYEGFTMISFILGAVYAALGVIAIVAAVGGTITALMAGTCVVVAVLSSVLMSIFSAISWLSTTVGPWFSTVTMALTIAVVAMYLINVLIQELKKVVKSEFQTEKPDYIIDARDTKDGSINVLYETARDKNNYIQDVNAAKQWKWVVLGYTRDPRIGSPIVADGSGNVFKQVNGNAGTQRGYECVKYFGERSPADLNAFCSKNTVKGAYLHYHTEESVKICEPEEAQEEAPADPAAGEPATGSDAAAHTETETGSGTAPRTDGSYLADLLVAVSADAETARNDIIKHSGKYYVFDHNLSPNQKVATYIGYSLTSDPEKAITDIRIAPNVGKSEKTNQIMYGDAVYTYSGVLGWDTGPGSKQGIPLCDAVYFTTDSIAGDPIPADNLVTADKLETYGKEESEWIPVSWFGNDQPYNFETQYDIYEDGTGYNYYGTKKDNDLNNRPSSYLYFKPENAKNSGTRYLSGILFAGGYESCNNQYFHDEIFGNPFQLFRKLEGNKKTTSPLGGANLAYAVNDRSFNSVMRATESRLLYTWTYYPKRALTNIVAYQGDNYSTSLSYTFSKPLDGIQQNFVAAISWQQQYNVDMDELIRFVAPGNMYMNRSTLLFDTETNYAKHFMDSRTETLPEGIPFGYKKTHFLPTALYLCGPTAKKEPLRLSDVIITEDTIHYTHADGAYHYDLAHSIGWSDQRDHGAVYTLAPDPDGRYHDSRLVATGDFRPVVDAKNPHSPNAFNLSYPETWDEDGDYRRDTYPVYIYLRGQLTDKPKYVSSLSVGAYSRAQFKKDNPDQKEKMADAIAEGTAMLTAAQSCRDEMIVYNIAAENQSDAWYNRQSGGIGKNDPPENVPAAYVGITRTDDPKEAITGVILYQLNEMIAPNEITVDGVKYTCAGSTMAIIMNGKKYFLYYSRNTGDSVGLPIEDIRIDTTPIIAGYATNLCADKNHELPYGNPDQTCFIHTKYTGNQEFFNKLYIGRGETKRAAMCDLLSQGCMECVDLDLNNGIRGDCIMLGYRSAGVDWDAVNAKKTDKAKQSELQFQTQEAIYDIIVTSGEPYHKEGIINKNVYYQPVANVDLNGWEGRELYMYFASPYYSATYNKKNNVSTNLPENVFSGYISHLAFAENDRVPYNTSVTSTGNNNFIRWEYVMQNGEVNPVDLNEGAVSYSSHHAKDVRISMFAQRSDGSVKPSGEITGGFVESTYNVGDINFN